MTEQEWLQSADPLAMLDVVRSQRTCRKLRLFVCAVCRADPSLMCHERLRQAVDVCERYADRECSDCEREELCDLAGEELNDANEDGDRWRPYHELAYGLVTGDEPTNWLWHDPSCWESNTVAPTFQAAVVRDLFRISTRRIVIDSACLTWNEGVVLRIAQTAYAERLLPSGELHRDRLAILADGLEDAGCTDGDILSHLRGPGPHYRGCFAIDLLLGKN